MNGSPPPNENPRVAYFRELHRLSLAVPPDNLCVMALVTSTVDNSATLIHHLEGVPEDVPPRRVLLGLIKTMLTVIETQMPEDQPEGVPDGSQA